MTATSINSLMSIWRTRLKDSNYDASYKDALNDCLYELTNLSYDSQEAFLSQLPSEEISQYLLEQEADSYLSSMEAHESIA